MFARSVDWKLDWTNGTVNLKCVFSTGRKAKKTGWPLVGNEGMNPQYTNVKVDSLIPY